MEGNSSNENSLNNSTNFQRNSHIARFKELLMQEDSISVKTKLMDLINTVRMDKESKTLKKIKETISKLSDEFQSVHKENAQNYENNLEAIENIVSKALHDELMAAASQKLVDEEVCKKMKRYANIKPEHLEINVDITSSVTYNRAIQDLSKIDYYKSPKDKLVMIVNACKLVNGMVWENSKNKDVPTGADDFQPVLIFTTIKASPENPVSNLSYVRELRATELLKGFADYYLTAYESVLDFIERLDISRLKISKEEHEDLIQPIYKEISLSKSQTSDTVTSNKDIPTTNNVDNLELKKKLDEAQIYNINNIKAIHLSGMKDYLYSNNAKNFKFEGKSKGNLFIDQLDGFFYEYNLVMRNYKKLSERVEHLQINNEKSSDKNEGIENYLGDNFVNKDSEGNNSVHKKNKPNETSDLI